MPKFGRTSRERLETCDHRLQAIANEVVKVFDCTVVCGHRNKEDQDKAVASGHSKATFPKGRHNAYPSLALDIVPYPVNWNNLERFCLFAGYFLAVGKKLYPDVEIIWGRDWGKDWYESDKNKPTFKDYPHFEIRD